MCVCTPSIRTPWCGRNGCQAPGQTVADRFTVVRTATSADAGAMVQLGMRFLREGPYPGITPDTAHVSSVVLAVLREGFAVVAQRGDDLVGMLLGMAFSNPITGRLTVSEIAWWMEPDYRGTRSAIEMFSALERWAVERNAWAIHFIAPAGSTVGKLYERHGYHPLETIWQKRVAA